MNAAVPARRDERRGVELGDDRRAVEGRIGAERCAVDDRDAAGAAFEVDRDMVVRLDGAARLQREGGRCLGEARCLDAQRDELDGSLQREAVERAVLGGEALLGALGASAPRHRDFAALAAIA